MARAAAQEFPFAVQDFDARAIEAHVLIQPVMIGRQLAICPSQPPNWMAIDRRRFSCP